MKLWFLSQSFDPPNITNVVVFNRVLHLRLYSLKPFKKQLVMKRDISRKQINMAEMNFSSKVGGHKDAQI